MLCARTYVEGFLFNVLRIHAVLYLRRPKDRHLNFIAFTFQLLANKTISARDSANQQFQSYGYKHYWG